ncbi:hypothetical protein BDDG_12743 [Blastomyces dermatitidis ATCC 18188]|uniref:Uncharacterized protein n=1 Tax=Ajellomyces dermatitidis (strain ATCC 18188 / CBS 674.68) TaxID=653446 RepID=A0A0J9EQN0_AJEDA|nr:hypothetical protein BDDG_12743 [Blastomyces dermatitidis ATCC 18188]
MRMKVMSRVEPQRGLGAARGVTDMIFFYLQRLLSTVKILSQQLFYESVKSSRDYTVHTELSQFNSDH